MKNFVTFSFLTLFSFFQVRGDYSQRFETMLQETRVEFSYNTGKYISIDKDYFETRLFAPIYLSNYYTTFLDVSSYRFNDGKWAASIGGGIRRSLCEKSVLGINAYYDYRRGESRHNLNQIGIGFEWLNHCWDFRINGYFPVSQKTEKYAFCVFDQLKGGFFATRHKVEYMYSGFDAEIGVPFVSYCDFSLYGAAGPYYYQRSHQHHFWGGYARLELDWRSILSLQVRVSYDKVYSTNVQGIFQISLPLDCFCSSWENWGKRYCLINQDVYRNGIILTDHCCNWTWNWDDSNSHSH